MSSTCFWNVVKRGVLGDSVRDLVAEAAILKQDTPPNRSFSGRCLRSEAARFDDKTQSIIKKCMIEKRSRGPPCIDFLEVARQWLRPYSVNAIANAKPTNSPEQISPASLPDASLKFGKRSCLYSTRRSHDVAQLECMD